MGQNMRFKYSLFVDLGLHGELLSARLRDESLREIVRHRGRFSGKFVLLRLHHPGASFPAAEKAACDTGATGN